MKAFLITRALQRAALAAMVVPACVACGGSSTSEGSGNSSGTSSGSSSGAAGGSGASSGAPSGSSTGPSGTSSTSGTSAGAQSGASGYSSGAASGSASGSTSGATTGSTSGASSDGGPPAGCSIKNPTSKGNCGTVTYDLTGSAGACSPNDDAGNLSSSECMALCPAQTFAFNTGMVTLNTSSCSIGQSADASGPQLDCFYPCPAGRRPEGLSLDAHEGPDAPARFLAQMAYLEQASVGAFECLARELEAHGAPRHLQAASRRAARDEVRHARVVKRLAEQAGAHVRKECAAPLRVRSLEEIAIENAVEGCVRETFGAAVAIVQARDAKDAGVRRAMQRIAKDEARHAKLAWEVAEWIDGQLDAKARRRVHRAGEKAVEQLRREATAFADIALTERLGMPSAAQASAMLDALGGSLWSRMAA